MLDPDKLIREGLLEGNTKKVQLGKKLKAQREAPIEPVQESAPVIQQKANGPVQGGKNTFVDDFSISKDLLQSEIQKRSEGKGLYADPVERSRQGTIDIKCRLCNKPYKSVLIGLLRKDSATQETYYECDTCIMARRSEI